MIQISRFKMFMIIAVCLYGFVYAAPNFVPALTSGSGWLPHKTVNLGLDLRGGAHLLYEVDIDGVYKKRIDNLAQDIKSFLQEKQLSRQGIETLENGVEVVLEDDASIEGLRQFIRQTNPQLLFAVVDKTVTVTLGDEYVAELQVQIISQVIEVVRRRIDELGTTEPVIARQGTNRVIIQAPGGDSKQLRDLIGTTAKLGFHVVGTQGRKKVTEIALPVVDEPGQRLNVKRNEEVSGEMLEDAAPSFGQAGDPVVTFRLNGVGARKFCLVTRKYVGQPFAIVLDQKVISAPRINEPICAGNGQISGNFTVEEASNLALLLRAGALPADMSVVEERSVGPSLGADSVEAGKIASVIGLLLVLCFMVLSYGLFGLMANVALVVNIGLLLAILSSLQATLTLPGIAGIVLTVGMAVDANVLIFERIREEIAAGRTALSAIDNGYSRAMATIVDSNLTTLIAAAILFSFGTGPIKGFAVTLAIGILTSFFSAIMVTRLLVVLWLQKTRPKTVPI